MFKRIRNWWSNRKDCPDCEGDGYVCINGVSKPCEKCLSSGKKRKKPFLKSSRRKNHYNERCFAYAQALKEAHKCMNLRARIEAEKDEKEIVKLSKRLDVSTANFKFFEKVHRELSEEYKEKYEK